MPKHLHAKDTSIAEAANRPPIPCKIQEIRLKSPISPFLDKRSLNVI